MTCLSGGWSPARFIGCTHLPEIATSLSCSFHLPGWQLTVPWLSRSPLLWLITSWMSYCAGINAQPLTVPPQNFNRGPSESPALFSAFKQRAKKVGFKRKAKASKRPKFKNVICAAPGIPVSLKLANQSRFDVYTSALDVAIFPLFF